MSIYSTSILFVGQATKSKIALLLMDVVILVFTLFGNYLIFKNNTFLIDFEKTTLLEVAQTNYMIDINNNSIYILITECKCAPKTLLTFSHALV